MRYLKLVPAMIIILHLCLLVGIKIEPLSIADIVVIFIEILRKKK